MRVVSPLILSGALSLSFALGGCNTGPEPTSEIQPETVALEAFSSCEHVESYLQEMELDQRQASIGYGTTTGALERNPYSYTRTNVQVPGIDEADIVKTDGKTIFVLSARTLYAVRSWPAAEMKLLSALTLAGDPRAMFLDELGHLVVLEEIAASSTNPTPLTKVTFVDTTNPTNLRIGRTYLSYGSYRGARRIGSSLRIASYHTFRWQDFQPARKALPNACTDFYRATVPPLHLGLTIIATVKLDSPWIHRAGIIGDVGEIYMAKNALYLAGGPNQTTYLHKFAFHDPYRAHWVASGKVEGKVLDPFAMDEHDGFLRVVTDRLTILGQNDRKLLTISELELVSGGEQVTGVRFLGNRGFVAGSGKAPLSALDLTDAEAPRIVGTMNVRGAPTYLHPLGPNHLLALGIDESYARLSIFDVGDLAAPRETYSTAVKSMGWEAIFEHKAFNYFPFSRTLALPFQTELRLFRVDAYTGIEQIGAIDMSDVSRMYDAGGLRWRWAPSVRRSVMADYYVYAISEAGVRVARSHAPKIPVATVRFDRPYLER